MRSTRLHVFVCVFQITNAPSQLQPTTTKMRHYVLSPVSAAKVCNSEMEELQSPGFGFTFCHQHCVEHDCRCMENPPPGRHRHDHTTVKHDCNTMVKVWVFGQTIDLPGEASFVRCPAGCQRTLSLSPALHRAHATVPSRPSGPLTFFIASAATTSTN